MFRPVGCIADRARGDVLLLEKENYQVGDTIPVVAQLKDAQRNPYEAAKCHRCMFLALDGRGCAPVC